MKGGKYQKEIVIILKNLRLRQTKKTIINKKRRWSITDIGA